MENKTPDDYDCYRPNVLRLCFEMVSRKYSNLRGNQLNFNLNSLVLMITYKIWNSSNFEEKKHCCCYLVSNH